LYCYALITIDSILDYYFFIYYCRCDEPLVSDVSNSGHILCPTFHGDLGNNMFQFASVLGIAMSKNMNIIVNCKSEINLVFKLNVDLRINTDICNNMQLLNEHISCGFDRKMVQLIKDNNFRVGQYLQSWKYFDTISGKLRKPLIFREHIDRNSREIVQNILLKRNVTRHTTTLVGVHIRRGNMINDKYFSNYGFEVATPQYLHRATSYYTRRYHGVLFIVTSAQNHAWAVKHMPTTHPSEFITTGRRELDMAILASCDHSIITVGSFGWWTGWLTNGEVTYFKLPAKPNSTLRKQCNHDYSDYFYPNWVGLS
jgi:galactoside 2-L-fucosyltransferase 1/2